MNKINTIGLIIIMLFILSSSVFVDYLKKENTILKQEVFQKDVLLKSYRISSGRNIMILDRTNEMKIIDEVCRYVKSSIPFMHAWRRYENGYPGHEMGIKRRIIKYNKHEQYYNAQIILYQEMSKFCMTNKKDFIPKLASRVNYYDRLNWSRSVLSILNEMDGK